VELDRYTDKNPLFTLFDRYGVGLPLATKGWVNRQVRAVQVKDDGTLTVWLPRGVKVSETFTRAVRSLKEAIITRGAAERVQKEVSEKLSEPIEKRNYAKLEELFPDFIHEKFSYLRLESDGFEPLSLEWVGDNKISVMHTYELNGDLMYDPMIEFEVNRANWTMTAVTFEQSAPSVYQVVTKDGGVSYDGNGNERKVQGLQKEINDFTETWLKHLSEQGFKPVRGIMLVNDEDARVEFGADGEPIIPEPEAPEVQSQTDDVPVILPDPSFGFSEMNLYGYHYDGMVPMTDAFALGFFDDGWTVYLLYPDNTEGMAFEREEIENHEGIFGMEKADWLSSREYAAALAKQERTQSSREAELLYGTGNMFGR
jgi:hypothetical protein